MEKVEKLNKRDVQFTRFVVWRCRCCGLWQSRENFTCIYGMSAQQKMMAIQKARATCTRCNRNTSFYDKRLGGLRVDTRWFDQAKDVARAVQSLSQPKVKK
jgi:hypothetical protein